VILVLMAGVFEDWPAGSLPPPPAAYSRSIENGSSHDFITFCVRWCVLDIDIQATIRIVGALWRWRRRPHETTPNG
jgi:hypothetical protein